MLSPAQADQYATQFLEAREQAKQMRPFPANAKISVEDAYFIARQIQAQRLAAGEVQIGRKIAFANQTLLKKYGRNAPIQGLVWTPLFSSTVRYLEETHVVQSLTGAVQPRLAPEIIFKLGTTPAPDASLTELADCLEWMAHGMEIVVCPFPRWEFNTADAIAAFGFHGSLLIGEPHQLASTTRHNLGGILGNTAVSLSCDSTLLSAGFGSNLLESPLHALWHLQQLLKNQPESTTLQAGEIVCTGTWTDLPQIKAGQTWSSAFSGASLAGLSISFV
ncbi:2-keto-4-pentenoate hydratase [Solimicrobium silvestre]|uniref:Fumarylacetoacetate (FAA) hydrolase family n=1 Tax=Solimicrobium silvestre TaxID=2099400 RepID=A0A2S9GV23_9BURK|nr:4-oxalocrotonate decarboxylase [Solimicrobium silvestre]PRC91582.1 Fumarylacetoacetate (FAA) hydrolase family [Solimicrobium silvestre]